MPDKLQGRAEIHKLDEDASLPDGLFRLLRTLFNGLTLRQWIWEYREGPSGPAHVWYARAADTCLVHYALLPVPMQIGDRPINGAKAEGSIADVQTITKTLPKADWRVFQRLVTESLHHAENSGLDLVYGFPNKSALGAQQKAGYETVGLPIINARAIRSPARYLKGRGQRVPHHFRVIDIGWRLFFSAWFAIVAKDSSCVRPLGEEDASALDRFNLEWGVRHPRGICAHRSWPYLDWRFRRNPYVRNEIFGLFGNGDNLLGVIVLSKEESPAGTIAHVQDIAALDVGSLRQLLRWAICRTARDKYSALEVWTQESRLHRGLNNALRRYGFLMRRPNRNKNMIVRSAGLPESLDAANWYVGKYLNRY